MRRAAWFVSVAALLAACGQPPVSINTTHSPSPSSAASATATAAPSAIATHSSAPSPPTSSPSPISAALTGNYGILLAGGYIELIKPDASIYAKANIGPSSVTSCSSNGDGAIQAPPTSASNSHVYFRDGDTKIRRLEVPTGATDITTVPGGPTVVSFFSVSPDDHRIAVLVEDLSAATTISLRLYVEDLVGHTSHSDIYTTSQPKGKAGTTLWPMGWHGGSLVLAVVIACTFEPAGLTPAEWHVSSSVTAVRQATIRQNNCTLSLWPSAAGVACVNYSSGATALFDWTGKTIGVTGPGSTGSNFTQTSLSPAGNSILFNTGFGIGAPPPLTGIVQLGPGPYASVQGHEACFWIDEDHMLAPDGVIQFPAETPGNVHVNATFKPVSQAGLCAGRFPGGL